MVQQFRPAQDEAQHSACNANTTGDDQKEKPAKIAGFLDVLYFQFSETSEIKWQAFEGNSCLRFELERYQTTTGSLRILLLLVLLLLIVLFAAAKETAEEAALFLGLLLLVGVLGVLCALAGCWGWPGGRTVGALLGGSGCWDPPPNPKIFWNRFLWSPLGCEQVLVGAVPSRKAA